ncbi:MAG: hypothetical protein KF819_21375, partial [Labilithrix sp.]|nr:hypothetical protein [Labilithrix sp.]
MRARVRRRLLLALLALPVAWACGREITIPDDVTPDAGPGEDAGADVAVDAIPDDAGLDVADVTCPLVTPDESAGVFVAPSGVNGASCGTKSAPCKTIAFGITRAVDKPTVYVARGTYVEHVTLKKDLEIVGGWDVTAGAWSRSCIEPEDATVIRAPSAERVTVEARDLGGEARLTLLRIESKGQSQVGAGESLYGVVATGASTSLALSNVRIEVVGAGSGTNGRPG